MHFYIFFLRSKNQPVQLENIQWPRNVDVTPYNNTHNSRASLPKLSSTKGPCGLLSNPPPPQASLVRQWTVTVWNVQIVDHNQRHRQREKKKSQLKQSIPKHNTIDIMKTSQKSGTFPGLSLGKDFSLLQSGCAVLEAAKRVASILCRYLTGMSPLQKAINVSRWLLLCTARFDNVTMRGNRKKGLLLKTYTEAILSHSSLCGVRYVAIPPATVDAAYDAFFTWRMLALLWIFRSWPKYVEVLVILEIITIITRIVQIVDQGPA